MPPKPKFTREEIVEAALGLVSEQGMEALTARDLGERLGSSARPIFTVFRSMEEVQQETRKAAMERFNGCIREAAGYTPLFKQVGVQMLRFAREEPRLFQLLFMTEHREERGFVQVFADLGEMAEVSVAAIQSDYGLTRQEACRLFQHIWVYAFGIGTLCASRVCCFSDEEINDMLGQTFTAFMLLARSGGLDAVTIRPAKKQADEAEHHI